MDNNIKAEIEKIVVPEDLHYDFKSGMEKAKKENDRYKNLQKKVNLKRNFIFGMGIAALFILFLFVAPSISPTMASFVSNIPVINSIVKTNPIFNIIAKELEENNYSSAYIDISVTSFHRKSVTVSVAGPEGYYEFNKEGIEATVQNALQAEEYDAFTVDVTKQNNSIPYELTEKEKVEKATLEEELKKTLNAMHIEFESIYVEPLSKSIYINIPSTGDNQDELKKQAESVQQEITIQNSYSSNYGIHVTAAGPEMSVTDDNVIIRPVTPIQTISSQLAQELTGKEKYKVTGFAYKEDPFTFIIRTSVNSNDKEHGEYLEETVNQFIKSNDLSQTLDESTYDIIIYSKDDVKIN